MKRRSAKNLLYSQQYIAGCSADFRGRLLEYKSMEKGRMKRNWNIKPVLFLSILLLYTHCAKSQEPEKISTTNRGSYGALIEQTAQFAGNGPADYVDPFIGTSGTGHTLPGASLPFGMVQVSPDTGGTDGDWLASGWNWCSGYHYSDKSILGFSHIHHSGMGIGDWGEILMMPATGPLKIIPGTAENPDSGYRSRFRHAEESAAPGYYRVRLSDYNILVELTASLRAGFHRYTFPEAGDGHILIDLDRGLGDTPFGCEIRIVGNNRMEGVRRSAGAVLYQKVYFSAEFSRPFDSFGTWKDGKASTGEKSAKGTGIGAYVNFKTKKGEKILVKMGISYTDIQEARKNLEAEIPHWDFDLVRSTAKAVWNNVLSKIDITVPAKTRELSVKKKEIFYTALYHSLMFPSIFSDADGTYVPAGNMSSGRRIASGFDYYSDYSMWDTFRAQMPLVTILEPQRTGDMITSLLESYKDSGWLPSPQMFGNYHSESMIGDHAASIILDAEIKGIGNFDKDTAYEALLKNAMVSGDNFAPGIGYGTGRLTLKSYRTLGYIPADLDVSYNNPLFLVANVYNQAVSKTLEYAFDDFCVAAFGKLINKTNDFDYLMKRSQNYRNVYDSRTGFMRGKSFTGSWVGGADFDPVAHYAFYVEGNAWQYTWSVQHDIEGLISLMGGRGPFIQKLEKLFIVKESAGVSEFFSADIAGMIGQYAHGNEPSHHVSYLFNYAGVPWKSQEWARRITDKFYKAGPEGICGNDDMGQMSAWYVFTSLGFYPIVPGIYAIASPTFERAEIDLAGKKLVITAKNASDKNIYVQEARLNGKKLSGPWFTHKGIANGGTLSFVMGPKPNMNWGARAEDAPPSYKDILKAIE
jgi:predicted alpha-1,2-mannosidase